MTGEHGSMDRVQYRKVLKRGERLMSTRCVSHMLRGARLLFSRQGLLAMHPIIGQLTSGASRRAACLPD